MPHVPQQDQPAPATNLEHGQPRCLLYAPQQQGVLLPAWPLSRPTSSSRLF